jgi:hypothetical protein
LAINPGRFMEVRFDEFQQASKWTVSVPRDQLPFLVPALGERAPDAVVGPPLLHLSCQVINFDHATWREHST